MTVLPGSRWATAQDYQRDRGFSESADGLAVGPGDGVPDGVSDGVPDGLGAGVGSDTGGTTASGADGRTGGRVVPHGSRARWSPRCSRTGRGKTLNSLWSPLVHG
jgi:hypothetical protein